MRCWADEEPPPAFPWLVFLAGFVTGIGLSALAFVLAWAGGG